MTAITLICCIHVCKPKKVHKDVSVCHRYLHAIDAIFHNIIYDYLSRKNVFVIFLFVLLHLYKMHVTIFVLCFVVAAVIV